MVQSRRIHGCHGCKRANRDAAHSGFRFAVHVARAEGCFQHNEPRHEISPRSRRVRVAAKFNRIEVGRADARVCHPRCNQATPSPTDEDSRIRRRRPCRRRRRRRPPAYLHSCAVPVCARRLDAAWRSAASRDMLSRATVFSIIFSKLILWNCPFKNFICL